MEKMKKKEKNKIILPSPLYRETLTHAHTNTKLKNRTTKKEGD